MNVTVIIPTYNGEKTLPLLLDSLAEQTYACEIMIVDSSSSDATVAIASQRGIPVVAIPKETFDHGGTRTMAAKASKAEIIVFLTQDALPCDSESIARLIKAFEDPKVGAAYGRQLPHPGETPFGAHLRRFNYGERSYVRSYEDRKRYGIKTAFLSNSFAAYRRSALEEIGWFRERLILGEDMVAGAELLKVGCRLAYVAEAAVYHSHGYTITQEFRRYFDIGVFHACEPWLLEAFGKPEGEGMRFVRSELSYLMAEKAYGLIPLAVIRNGMKFLGYKAGRHFRMLPRSLIIRLSMHPRWWLRYN
jgi:rhamnosyltransferase